MNQPVTRWHATCLYGVTAADFGTENPTALEVSVKPETTSLYDNGMRSGAVTPPSVTNTFRSPMRPTTSEGTYKFDPDRPRPNLTLREKEVLRLVCDGLTNAEIATKLTVSRETIKSELKRIFRKIGVANRTQAAVLLVKQGWV
jgi:DNA-binding NarL/FixJ family response regulator